MVTRLYQIETGSIALKVFTDGASKSLASPSASFDPTRDGQTSRVMHPESRGPTVCFDQGQC